MSEVSKCPKCGGRLMHIHASLASFDCQDCGQRMDKRDYIEWALKNYGYKINKEDLFRTAFRGVNSET